MSKTTDLECAVLGAVWQNAPCTPYVVRKFFNDSLSAHWRASTGSIYPIIERLHERKLVSLKSNRKLHQSAKYLRITAKGKRALTRWLSSPAPDGSQLMVFDPLRMQVLFLEILEPEERKVFLNRAKAALSDHLERGRLDVSERKKQNDHFEMLIAKGAVMSIESQLKWIGLVQKELDAIDQPT